MRNTLKLIYKDIKILLHPSLLLYLLLSPVMAFIPHYPVFVGPFYILIGIMVTFSHEAENRDKEFAAILPVTKNDCVKAKVLIVFMLEIITLILTVPCQILSIKFIDMQISGMECSLISFAGILTGYSAANVLMLNANFKNNFKVVGSSIIGFLLYFTICIAFSFIGSIPGLELLKGNGTQNLLTQLPFFAISVFIYIMTLVLTYKRSCKYYEKAEI